MSKPAKRLSLSDIIEQRQDESRADVALVAAITAQKARIASILRDHPEIGELCREGSRVFYANRPEYSEASDPASLT